jgi:hypothetical protein
VDSDFISGGETVKDVSQIADGFARCDKSFSTTVKIQFRAQGIYLYFVGNLPGASL